jgi:hypothetical protein
MEETAIVALLTQMIRNGIIDDDTIHDAADECEASDQPMAAHQLRCLIVEANSAPAVERHRAAVRASLTPIDGGKAS